MFRIMSVKYILISVLEIGTTLHLSDSMNFDPDIILFVASEHTCVQ